MLCPKCGYGMYVLDSKDIYFGDTIGKEKKKTKSKLTTARQRKWGCNNCRRRFFSTEIVNPTPYSRYKGVPKSILEKS